MAFLQEKNRILAFLVLILSLVYNSHALSQGVEGTPVPDEKIDVFDVKTEELDTNLADDLTVPDFDSANDDINAFTEGLFGEGGDPDFPAPPLPQNNIASEITDRVEPTQGKITDGEAVVQPENDEEMQKQALEKFLKTESPKEKPLIEVKDDELDTPFMEADEDLFGDIPTYQDQPPVEVITSGEEVTEPAEAETPKQISSIEGKSEEEKAQYRELKGHLLNFIKSLSGGEIIEVVSAEEEIEEKENMIEVVTMEPTPEEKEITADEIVKSSDQEELAKQDGDITEIVGAIEKQPSPENNIATKEDNFEDFLASENDESTEPAEISEADDSGLIGQITEDITKATEKQVQSFAGNCLDLPIKVNECEEFTCTMPESKGSDVMLKKKVSLNDKNECEFTETKNDKLAFDCILNDRSKQALSTSVVEHFALAGAKPFKISSELQEICSSSDKTQIANNTTKLSPAKKPFDVTKIEKQPTLEESITSEDKAYFQLLEEKRKSLPYNKQLSDDTRDVMEAITPSLIPRKRPEDKATKYIAIRRGDDLSIKNNNMQMSVNNDKAGHFNIKEKMETAYRALLAGQISASVSIYKDILDKQHDNKEALFGLATAYHRNSQFEQARSIYIEVLKIDPNNKEVLNNFLVLVAEESPENALIELKKLERINSDFSPIPAQIAMIHLKNKKPKKAERYLRRAVILSPDNVTYKYNLAITSDRLGKYHQAARLYRQILDSVKQGAVIPGSADGIMDRLYFLEEKIRANG